MALKYIEIGGQDRPILFGFGAAAIFKENTGKDIFTFFQEFSQMQVEPAHVVALVSAGLENGAEFKGEPFTATQRQVGTWLDAAGVKILDTIIPMAVSAMGINLEAETEPDPKKKGTVKPK